jgi:transcriptional regulator with XRE-family HTH domain
MIFIRLFYGLIKGSNPLTTLGERARSLRTMLDIKQTELAAQAAVSVETISSLENGRSITTESLNRVLIALGQPEALINLLPEPAISPFELQKLKGRRRQRVR